jgi:hypothetical protein
MKDGADGVADFGKCRRNAFSRRTVLPSYASAHRFSPTLGWKLRADRSMSNLKIATAKGA